MRLVSVAALVGASVLGACSSGGSNSGGGSVVTPSPSPSTGATPSPTPSPAPSYTKFADLAGDQTFASTCTALNVGSPPVLIPASLPDQGLTFGYAADTRSWAVNGNGISLIFIPSERDPSLPATTIAYNKTSSSPVERLRISTVGVGTTPAEYFRSVLLIANEPGAPGRNYSCIIGVKTLVTDVPPGTAINFPNSRLSGYLFRTLPGSGGFTQFSMNNTTVGFDVDLSRGEVKMVIRLIGTPLPTGSGADIDFGTVTAVANIDPATGGWYGTTFTSPDMATLFTQVGGRFFGPQGREAGYALTMLTEKPDGTRLYLSGTGVALR